MKASTPLLIILVFSCFLNYAQNAPARSGSSPVLQQKAQTDSQEASRKDSLRMARFSSLAYYPLLKAGPMSGVLPISGVDEIPDPSRDYKILFEFTINPVDSTHKKINDGLVEICRIINLHIASGIPLNHIHAVVVAHGPSVYSILNNQAFQENFKTENPNQKVVEDLQKAGVKFIACGQYMAFKELSKAQLMPGIKLSLTAKTVLSNYIGQGYVWYDIGEEK